MSDQAIAVAAAGLAVGYRGREVVAHIDISLAAGQALALVGTNGSGKSTLLKTLVGLLPPLQGRMEVLGGEPRAVGRRIGYLGQFHTAGGVLPLRVRDVVVMGRYPRRGLLRRLTKLDHDTVTRSLERVDVAHLSNLPLRALSGGQQQRVYLAQALAREADLLVLDEPTAGLDAGSVERYLQIVDEELARGAAVVVATHDIGQAMRATQVILLAGRVVASGPPSQVLIADQLLDAFGIALAGVEHGDHQDLLAPEQSHGHREA